MARLEPLSVEHAPGLRAAGEDPAIWRYLPWPRPETVEAMTAWIERLLEESDGGSVVPFTIVERASNMVAGTTRYMDIQRAHRGLEIGGTWLGPRWQRTALNTECKRLLLQHAFQTLGAIRVQLKTDDRNERSKRAIQRIGARYEGTLRHSMIMPDEHWRDTACFSVLAEEWPAVHARLRELSAGRPSGTARSASRRP